MSRLLGICLISLLLLTGCGAPAPAATPAPPTATALPPTDTPEPPTATPVPPTSTPEPTATPAPEPTETPPPAQESALPEGWATFADEERGLWLHHPDAWDVVGPDADELAELFAEAENELASESLQAMLGQMLATPEALELFAALGFLFDDPAVAQNNFVSNFTAIVAPADGLTLDSYADIVSAQLGSVDAIAMESAQVESGLRPRGEDVASLHYTIDGAALYNLPDGSEIHGWQVALYDEGGERLLILTFTALSDSFAELDETFRTLLYHLEFK